MNSYKVGDAVIVRADLSPAEKKEWPSFVPEMEPLMGRAYTIDIINADGAVYLRQSPFDTNAPRPSYWCFKESWLLPYGVVEEDDDVDVSAVCDLL